MNKKNVIMTLTYGGTVPFFLCIILDTYYGASGYLDFTRALILYGAIIASFISGTHWGIHLSQNINFNMLLHSNVSALLAWVNLLLPEPFSLVLLIGVFIYLLVLENKIASERLIEAWYFALRQRATAIVICCLIIPLYF